MKTEIIKAALNEFAVNGYEETSLNSICSQVGCSKSGLYHYFRSKDDLLISCCEYVNNSIISAMSNFSHDENAGIEGNLLRFFAKLSEICRENKSFNPILYITFFLPPANCALDIAAVKDIYFDKMTNIIAEKVLPPQSQITADEAAKAFFVATFYCAPSYLLSWSPDDSQLRHEASANHFADAASIMHNYLFGALGEHDRELEKQFEEKNK